ncbi:MAG TPA: histidine kinase [Chitinophagaceae bacterium]
MLSQNFIFSEKRGDRILRHLLFWMALAVYFTILHSANPLLKPQSSYFSNYPAVFVRSLMMQIPQAFCAYAILYIAVPLFLKIKNLTLPLICATGIWVATAAISIMVTGFITPHVVNWVLPEKWYRYMEIPPMPNIVVALFSVTKGVFTGAGFLVMLHFVKQWYMKEQRNLLLQKENTASQLKLLTAQVHPHFLFNTLNNIYSQTQTESPKGSKMIMELSDMLRYILAEGRKPLVPLQEDLSMIRDYINLEKIRYGNNLDLHLSIPADTGQLQIAPLLLLPFVENCFKHGASKFLTAPWINLKIEVNGRQLIMKLMNGKDPNQHDRKSEPGSGINNVRKRLELLYPNKHELQISNEPEVFVVNLRIELTDGKPVAKTVPEPATTVAAGYA